MAIAQLHVEWHGLLFHLAHSPLSELTPREASHVGDGGEATQSDMSRF